MQPNTLTCDFYIIGQMILTVETVDIKTFFTLKLILLLNAIISRLTVQVHFSPLLWFQYFQFIGCRDYALLLTRPQLLVCVHCVACNVFTLSLCFCETPMLWMKPSLQAVFTCPGVVSLYTGSFVL